jgi:2-keto-3-deoxy-6-phosphogluconate aldolase
LKWKCSDDTVEIAAELGCKVVKQFPAQRYCPVMHQAFISAGADGKEKI